MCTIYHLRLNNLISTLSLIYPEDGTSPVGAGPVVVVVVLVGLGSDPESSPLGGNKIQCADMAIGNGL